MSRKPSSSCHVSPPSREANTSGGFAPATTQPGVVGLTAIDLMICPSSPTLCHVRPASSERSTPAPCVPAKSRSGLCGSTVRQRTSSPGSRCSTCHCPLRNAARAMPGRVLLMNTVSLIPDADLPTSDRAPRRGCAASPARRSRRHPPPGTRQWRSQGFPGGPPHAACRGRHP